MRLQELRACAPPGASVFAGCSGSHPKIRLASGRNNQRRNENGREEREDGGTTAPCRRLRLRYTRRAGTRERYARRSPARHRMWIDAAFRRQNGASRTPAQARGKTPARASVANHNSEQGENKVGRVNQGRRSSCLVVWLCTTPDRRAKTNRRRSIRQTSQCRC